MPPALKPAYLVHGDDHGAVAERRAGLRALAEAPGGEGSAEVLSGDAANPAGVAAALATMTLVAGRRVIIVDGAERWRQEDSLARLVPALQDIPPETTVAIFAREDARAKAPAAVHDAVKRAGGQIVPQLTVRPWELPKWTREQAARIGLTLDSAAAKALVARVGERQQRLLRELEKLALEDGDGDVARVITGEEIELRAARSAELRAYALADALVAGDAPGALAAYLALRAQGERVAGLTYVMAQRLRDALAIALRLAAGASPSEVKRGLRMPARAAERLLADVSRSDPDRLRGALSVLAQLEIDARGGDPISASRSPLAGMDEDTLVLRAIETISR